MNTHNVSGMAQYVETLNNQKKILQSAQSRKGQRFVGRKSRDELSTLFRIRLMMSQQTRPDLNMRTAFIPPAYSPCLRSLSDLKSIAIKDLLLETHHRGKYIFLRSITPPDRMTAVMAIVEDENNDAVMLQLYFQEEENVRTADDILEEGTILIVKEPYLKLMADGDFGIRIDHPSDLVYVPLDDERVPSHWQPRLMEIDISAESLRKKGNMYFNDSKYQRAIEQYTKALSSSPEAGEAQILTLNRALAFIQAKNFDAALSDLESIPTSPKPAEKALYRKSQALYNLQKYRECCEVLETLALEYPDNKQAQGELLRARQRLLEQQSGTYTFMQLYAGAKTLRPPHLDHATYVGPVAIKSSGAKGRGLFTTKAVKAGDLLLCEKAFAHAFASEGDEKLEGGQDVTILINLERNSMTMGAQAELIRMVFEKVSKNPSLASVITDLHHGSYQSVGVSTVDGAPVVDTFFIERVVTLNGFGCPLSSRQTYLQDKKDEMKKKDPEKQFHSCGIWPMASYINHGCYSNARRAFIGDMMIVRATQDLAPDTELRFWYHTPAVGSNEDHRKKFQHWGFVCDCAICQDDRATAKSILASRKQQRAEVHRYFMTGAQASPAKIERIIAKMSDQYIHPASEVPRLYVWDLYFHLAELYMLKKQPDKAINSVLNALSALGYVIEGGKRPHVTGTPIIVKQWGLFVDPIIECWILLTVAYHMVAPDLEAYAEKYAKMSYKICVGEDETFEKTHGSSGKGT